MRSPIMLLPLLCLILLPMNAAAQTQQRQELLSTEEWVDLYNKDAKISVSYLKGVLDTLGAIGNFTCTKPFVLADSAARIRVEWVEQPEKMHTWFIFALMADLTKNYLCRFTDRRAIENEGLPQIKLKTAKARGLSAPRSGAVPPSR